MDVWVPCICSVPFMADRAESHYKCPEDTIRGISDLFLSVYTSVVIHEEIVGVALIWGN